MASVTLGVDVPFFKTYAAAGLGIGAQKYERIAIAVTEVYRNAVSVQIKITDQFPSSEELKKGLEELLAEEPAGNPFCNYIDYELGETVEGLSKDEEMTFLNETQEMYTFPQVERLTYSVEDQVATNPKDRKKLVEKVMEAVLAHLPNLVE